jgi:hypothetical protein
MTTCATDPTEGDVVCSTENVLLVPNKSVRRSEVSHRHAETGAR